MNNFQTKLSKNILFAKSFTPYDFKETMGQLAVKITWTDGDIDMLTTPMPKEKGHDNGDFIDEAEYFEFINWLIENKVVKS